MAFKLICTVFLNDVYITVVLDRGTNSSFWGMEDNFKDGDDSDEAD